jgi:ElaB/YqjD/DUF883 family membrane-anchored ribosome-binding protein
MSDEPTAPSMTPLEKTRAELEATRRQLSVSAAQLRHDMLSALPWRTWARERPWAMVVAAAALGFALGFRRLYPPSSGAQHEHPRRLCE